jgi:preprotein translocase subunit SecA
LTEAGIEKAERFFNIDNISGAEQMETNHFINNALRAHLLFDLNDDYIINKDKEIIIVDSNTGRMKIGNRYSDGLHQAIEAKEGVPIRNEDKTVATVTIQNLFKLYAKLSGMTGTAKTEEMEFQKIYGVDVVCIPTNKNLAREDAPDVVFNTMEQKYEVLLEDVLYRYERGQPVLIGTTTIEKSEEVSRLLKTKKIPHVVLNAKNHEQEGDIVAQAGKIGAVTIATNMAGRGTDILLGGNPEYLAKQHLKKEGLDDEQIDNATSFHDTKDDEVLALRKSFRDLYDRFKEQTDEEKQKIIELGGLHIIGTERHDSRRIDNQLRGRSGRQGDPGSSIFYISCEDEMIKRFGKSIIGGMLRFAVGDGMQSRLLTRMFERVQKAVEGFYFDSRRGTFEYDNVMNDQRKIIYGERNQILDGEDVHKQILNMFPDLVNKVVAQAIDTDKTWREWDLERANQILGHQLFGKEVAYLDKANTEGADYTDIEAMVLDAVIEQYEAKVQMVKDKYGLDFAEVERRVLLQIIDEKWMDHIDATVILRQGIHLRGFGQRDPLIEFRRETGAMFNEMVESISHFVALSLFKIEVVEAEPQPQRETMSVTAGHGADTAKKPVAAEAPSAGPQTTYTNLKKDTGRNDPCPCKSGKKFKSCCGA